MKPNKTMLFLFLTPAVFSFLLVFLYPSLRTILMSFFYVKTVTAPLVEWNFVGFDNFIMLMKSSMFIQSMKNIFYIWLWGGIGVFIISLYFSVVLTSGIKGKKFFRGVLYLPNVVSAIAMATMWIQYAFSSKYGLFKTIFEFLHWDSMAAFQWTSPDHQLLSMTIAYSFGMVGYFVLILMAGIEKIPADYYEVATIEGANRYKQFTHITFPLMKSVFKTCIVTWSITAIAFFIWSQMFSPLDADVGTITPMVYMYNLVFGRNITVSNPDLLNAGAGAAVGTIMTTCVVIIFGLVNLLIRDDKLEF